jgi:hypothetical protein
MTTQKDFKRVVRARMRKTGEAYTTARAQLLTRKQAPFLPVPAAAVAASPSPAPADYARIAGISDAALKAKTGCTWERWVKALDRAEAHAWPHRAIAEYVHEKYQVPSWWTQMVTVGYERIRGLRVVGQRRSGAYRASRSRTFPVSVSRLYGAFSTPRGRAAWLPGVNLTVRTATRNRSLRITWGDGTSVDLLFTARTRAKSQVQLDHDKLGSRAAVDRMKAYWGERFDALAGQLAPGRPRAG